MRSAHFSDASEARQRLDGFGAMRRAVRFFVLIGLASAWLLSSVAHSLAYDIGAPPKPTETESPQKPSLPSDAKAAEKKERQEKVVRALQEFYNNIQNKTMADKIGKWYNEGRLIFGDTGGDSASYSGGKVTVHEGMAEGILKGGIPDAGPLASLAASIFHEFVHADQTSITEIIRWAQSEYNNYYFGGHKSEMDAYFGTLAQMAGWVTSQKAKLDAIPKDKTACYKATLAGDIVKLCDEFGKYYGEIKDKGLDKRREVDKQYNDAKTRMAELKDQISTYETGQWVQSLSKTRDYEYSNKLSNMIGENRKKIKELEETLTKLDKRFKDTWLDLDKHTWKTPDGKELTNEEVARQVAAIKSESDAIVKECDKQMGKPADSPTPPKPPEPPKAPKKFTELTKEEKNKLMGCLCGCNITVGVWGGYYPEPIKNSSPSCEGTSGGPCASGNWGCGRFYPTTEGSCFEGCAKSVDVDPNSIKSEINRTKFKAYNDFIGEARSIIEEYIKFIPGVYRKKTSQKNGNGNGEYALLALNFSERASDGQALYASAAGDVPMTYIEMVKEKNRRGDPDRALGLVRAAESVMPERKGEIQNILAEFAIMMSKASLNIVTDLEFDEGLYLLRKAAEFYKSGESSPLGETIKRLIKNFEKWQQDWQTIKAEVPNCLSMIKDKLVCECKKLMEEKISPASNSFIVYEHASTQKWEISTGFGRPRPIPKKDKLMADLEQNLEQAQRKCASHRALKTKDMAQLTDYETYKFLEKSPYIKKEDLKDAALPISDEQAIKKAEKLLAEPGLCDCEKEKLKGILDTAKEDFKYSKLEVDLTASKKSLLLGEYLRVSLIIKNGRKPYTYSMTGDLTANVRGTEVGAITGYQPETAGTKTVKAVVTDAAGDTRTASVTFDVLSPAGAFSTKKQSSYDPTKDPNIKGSGKTVDTASVESAGKEFQDTKRGTKKIDGKAADAQPTAQPDTYAGTGKTKEDTDAEQAQKPPYPPYYPPPDEKMGSGTDWTKWAQTPTKKPEESTTKKPSEGTTATTSTITTTSSTTSPTSSTTSTGTSQGVYITAVIKNQSDQNVHISTDSNKLFGSYGSETRLTPGQSREMQIKIPPNRITFYSGRNGQIISSKTWEADPDHLNRYPMVYFTKGMGGKEELAITTNLK